MKSLRCLFGHSMQVVASKQMILESVSPRTGEINRGEKVLLYIKKCSRCRTEHAWCVGYDKKKEIDVLYARSLIDDKS
jgi:phage FluMu protein Com